VAGLVLTLAVAVTLWPAVAGAASFEIEIAESGYQPAQLTVRVGDTVTWTNMDSRTHTVQSDAGTELSSGDLDAGEAYGHVFETPGSYPYRCSIHPDQYRGTITVLAALPTTPGGSPEPTPPAGTLPPNFSPFPTTGPLPSPSPSPTLVPASPFPGASASPPGPGGGDPGSTAAVMIAGALILAGGGIALYLARRRA
jgi:plastocyanin